MTETFIVTDRAGEMVAGRRTAGIAPGPDGLRRIVLTAPEALYELALGSIEREPSAPLPAVVPSEDAPAPAAEPARHRARRSDGPSEG